MKPQRFKSVWDALEDDPVVRKNLKMRSNLMIAIRKKLDAIHGTQADKAEMIGITQPRLNDLLKGKIEKFRLDMLVNIAHKLKLKVQLKIAA